MRENVVTMAPANVKDGALEESSPTDDGTEMLEVLVGDPTVTIIFIPSSHWLSTVERKKREPLAMRLAVKPLPKTIPGLVQFSYSARVDVSATL
ncbi:hypothetical protein TIFTF001_039270 [Ficus carica]|uniref:Uncharacterized protein n=1 Tax=Ficus carica TaxID=3494 RepID=A0AA88E8W6_FICCA|nr:hypothetical protein TIFTF001_039270 [Ficus carica]